MRIPAAAPVRRSAVPVLGLVLLLAAAGVLGPAGCGKDPQEGEAGSARREAMVPAAAVDSSALATPDSLPAAAVEVPPAAATAAETEQPVAPPPATTPSVSAPAAVSPAGTWSVQAGSFRQRDNAETLARRIRALGFSPLIETAQPGGVTTYRVVVPGLADRQAAERVGERLRSELNISYLIRSSR